MTPRLLPVALLSALIFPPEAARSQESKKDDRAAQLLKMCLHNMSRLSTVACSTVHNKSSAFPMGGNSGKEEIDVVYHRGGTYTAAIDGGDFEVVGHHGRTVVREEDGEWKLRRNRLTRGERMPFVLDPRALWTGLVPLVADAKLGPPTTVNDVQVQTIHLKVKDKRARELFWSGALPEAQSNSAVFIGGFGGRMRPPAPNLTYDMTIFIDPGTRLIQKIDVKATKKSQGNMLVGPGGGIVGPGGGIVVRGRKVADQDEKEEEEDEEKKKDDKKKDDKKKSSKAKNKKAKEEEEENDGLIGNPQVAQVVFGGGMGGKVKPTKFSINFREHDKAVFAIDDKARSMLEIPAGLGK